MTNEQKVEQIRKWIDPEERVTVGFRDEQDLNAAITGCSTESVDLAIDTRVPHLKQRISVPLSRTDVAEDPFHYTRDPDRPLKHRRLMLVIDDKRPSVIY